MFNARLAAAAFNTAVVNSFVIKQRQKNVELLKITEDNFVCVGSKLNCLLSFRYVSNGCLAFKKHQTFFRILLLICVK